VLFERSVAENPIAIGRIARPPTDKEGGTPKFQKQKTNPSHSRQPLKTSAVNGDSRKPNFNFKPYSFHTWNSPPILHTHDGLFPYKTLYLGFKFKRIAIFLLLYIYNSNNKLK